MILTRIGVYTGASSKLDWLLKTRLATIRLPSSTAGVLKSNELKNELFLFFYRVSIDDDDDDDDDDARFIAIHDGTYRGIDGNSSRPNSLDQSPLF